MRSLYGRSPGATTATLGAVVGLACAFARVAANAPGAVEAAGRTGCSANARCSADDRKIGALLIGLRRSRCASAPARRSHRPGAALRGAPFLHVLRAAL